MSPDNLKKLKKTLANGNMQKPILSLERVMEKLYSYHKSQVNIEFSYNHTNAFSKLIIRVPNYTIDIHTGGHCYINDHENNKEFWIIDIGKNLFYFMEDITGRSIDELSFGNMKTETITYNFS